MNFSKDKIQLLKEPADLDKPKEFQIENPALIITLPNNDSRNRAKDIKEKVSCEIAKRYILQFRHKHNVIVESQKEFQDNIKQKHKIKEECHVFNVLILQRLQLKCYYIRNVEEWRYVYNIYDDVPNQYYFVVWL